MFKKSNSGLPTIGPGEQVSSCTVVMGSTSGSLAQRLFLLWLLNPSSLSGRPASILTIPIRTSTERNLSNLGVCRSTILTWHCKHWGFKHILINASDKLGYSNPSEWKTPWQSLRKYWAWIFFFGWGSHLSDKGSNPSEFIWYLSDGRFQSLQIWKLAIVSTNRAKKAVSYRSSFKTSFLYFFHVFTLNGPKRSINNKKYSKIF